MRHAVPLVLSLAACAAPDLGAGAGARDSAGVRIVESTAPTGPAWTVAAEPAVVIGTTDQDVNQQLFRVADAARLKDGRIAVAVAGEFEIRLFDAQGRFLRRMGSRGAGPGEFERLATLSLRGDSLVAYDSRHGRLSVFDDAGRFQRSVSLGAPGTRAPLIVLPLSDDRLLARGGPIIGPDATPGVKRDSAPVTVYDFDGMLVDTVGIFPDLERLVVALPNGVSVTGAAFGRSTMVQGHDGLVYLADNDRWEIRVHAPAGQLRRIIRLLGAPVRVTSDDIAAYRERRLAGAPANADGRMRDMLERMTYPETFPAFSGLAIDAAGYLWVREYTVDGTWPRRWRVFAPEGQLLTEVELPEGFAPFEVGADYVLGRVADPDGVEFIHVLALTRTP